MTDKVFEKSCSTCKRVFKTENDFLENTTQWRLCSADNLWFNCNCGSTLMLPKGKFPWYNPAAGLSNEAQSVFNKIAIINELPHIPSAVMNIQQQLQNADVSNADLAKAVKGDPFLAAEILRVAENLRNLRTKHDSPMDSLEHAISYIGRKSMGDLVLAASIKGFDLPTESFDEREFWRHSFLTGAISEILISELDVKVDKDKAYLAGSLANIGKVISAICFPDKTDLVYEYVKDIETMTSWTNAEKQVGLVSHTILGEIGAALWGLPKFVIESARYHHSKMDKRKAQSKAGVGAVVGLANLLAHWSLLEPHRIEDDLLENYKKTFNIDDKKMESIVNDFVIPVKSSLQI